MDQSFIDNFREPFTAHGEDETREFAHRLADALSPGDIIALTGDLGAGKTTLTKYIAEGLGVTETVDSPTFNIVKEYRSGRIPLFHFDVYRLGSIEEFYDIGAEDYLYDGGVSVIEWADVVSDAIPEDALLIQIDYGEKEGERIYTCIF